MEDYYNILGVRQNASPAEIKKAFRALAKKYHPDNDSGNKMKFEEINLAYQILGDEEKRKAYDERKNQKKDSKNSYHQSKNASTSKAESSAKRSTDPYQNIQEQFASFFGFRPGESPKQSNQKEGKPLDTSEIFSSYFKPGKGKKF